MSQIVYRMQDDKGRGPFQPGLTKLWISERYDHENLVPFYEEDEFISAAFKPDKNVYYGCGCESTEQLRRWFTLDEYRKLHGFGFKCVSMRVDNVIYRSDIQCLFSRRVELNYDVGIINLYPVRIINVRFG